MITPILQPSLLFYSLVVPVTTTTTTTTTPTTTTTTTTTTTPTTTTTTTTTTTIPPLTSLIPCLSNNSSGPGLASASGNSVDAWMAFDCSPVSLWGYNSFPAQTVHWIQYQFSIATIATYYSAAGSNPTANSYIQASNDGTTFVNLVLADTAGNIHSLGNSTAYLYYRLSYGDAFYNATVADFSLYKVT